MSKCQNIPVIILLYVKKTVPEWSGFTTWAIGFTGLASARFKCLCYSTYYDSGVVLQLNHPLWQRKPCRICFLMYLNKVKRSGCWLLAFSF